MGYGWLPAVISQNNRRPLPQILDSDKIFREKMKYISVGFFSPFFVCGGGGGACMCGGVGGCVHLCVGVCACVWAGERG